MKNEITLTLRSFHVLAIDNRTGEGEAITVTVTKDQLRAAQVVGQSSRELIERLCSRDGFHVLEIGTPQKLTIKLDLAELYEQYFEQRYEKRGLASTVEQDDDLDVLHVNGGTNDTDR